MKILKLITVLSICIGFNSCSESSESSSQANLIIKFKFDPAQVRLNNLGQPATIPTGNAAQSPDFAKMSANYIEFAPTATTLLGNGEIIYEGDETDEGGSNAIDFDNAVFAGNNETFLTIPLSQISNGNYQWVRVSLVYQEGSIGFLAEDGNEYNGTLASFVGYNTYLLLI